MSLQATVPASAGGEKQAPLDALRRLFHTMPTIVVLSFLIFVVLLAAGLLSPLISPYDISEQQLLARLQPPMLLGGTEAHPLGTDHLGRDLLSRLLAATRTTLIIAGLGVLIGAITGLIAGLISGSAGGWFDNVFMMLVDAQASIPLTLLALTAVAIAGTSPLVLILIVGISDYDKYARVVRAQVIAIRQRTFVEAARALGASPWRVAVRHVLPNIVSPLIVLATINFSSIVILESALSFLGVGVQPPHTSLGQLLGEARDYLITTWWLAAIPAAVIVTITMAVSLIGDWLRDVLDPSLER